MQLEAAIGLQSAKPWPIGVLALTGSNHPLFVLAYPVLSTPDRTFIDRYRREYDTAYVDVVEPHFTLVFGCQAASESDVCNHVNNVSAQFQPIEFVCRYAMLGVDHASPTGHVFLVPDEGYSAISLCHDSLYAGLLEPSHRLDIPFTPHMAIGTAPSLQEAKRLCDDLNRGGLKIEGSVETLTVSLLVDHRILDIEHHQLEAD